MFAKLIFLILWMCIVSAQKIDKDLEKAPKRKGRTLGHIAGKLYWLIHSEKVIKDMIVALEKFWGDYFFAIFLGGT